MGDGIYKLFRFLWTKMHKSVILTKKDRRQWITMDEKKEEKKNRVLKGQIPTSVFFILFGLSLALMPVNTVNILCKVVFGLVLIGAGLYHVFIFVMEKENATILDLFSGVIVMVIGVFLFMNPQIVVKLLTLLLGAFILVDSIWMLRGSLKLKKRIVGTWKAFLAAALLFVALGVLILINPFSQLKVTMQVAGWIFVINGVVDIIFYFLLSHGMKKEIPEKEEKKETDKSYKSYEEAEAEIYEEYPQTEVVSDGAVLEMNSEEDQEKSEEEAGKDVPEAETSEGEASLEENKEIPAEQEKEEKQEIPQEQLQQPEGEPEKKMTEETSETEEEEVPEEEEVLEEWKD